MGKSQTLTCEDILLKVVVRHERGGTSGEARAGRHERGGTSGEAGRWKLRREIERRRNAATSARARARNRNLSLYSSTG